MTNADEEKLLTLPRKKINFWNLVWLIIFIGGLFVSTGVTKTSLNAFFTNFDQFSDIFVQMLHPNWAYMETVIPLLLETIKMAVLGTVIGSVLAFVYSLLIARNIVKNKAITGILRVIMNIIRTVPDLLLGAVFVAIVGIGPVAGILALAICTFGIVVKLFYEAIETIDPGPIEALTAVGANKLQIIVFAVLPQVITYFISYCLYAFEINVRASTVLGYIGAGGIGLYLQQTLQVFDYAKTGTIIIVIILVVVLIDYVSSKSREALMK
ncbi:MULTISPECIES: phosphonate ABC transporter, permease protein PhnE [unclassified Lactobacillus]|uniref:phosphonate ABC transporter, permease protein PhnE n=1 Tax=unclassified Lactobacillus TaxID=2620435 RepID=UPI000EFD2E1A|nr:MULTISPECIES: phosphonate ABC transporter, permease protein PhnE [unclassified Lactobacillus]RMC23562.1 phosphonate ABC transporter, permease protein PhnE [Lactobacillus sp. ESL0247]RMC27361.1 phosphonate ABC transporter, permease protein PhnE [Lactobacillus sp. ESL0246]RMC30487.1 phosphonate ABC transporter, permease protein PhnE [Lactobacillus sp. ESL0245]